MPKAKLRNIIIPLGVLAGAILIVLVMVLSRPTPTAGELKEKSWAVAVQTVELGTYTPNLQLYGKIESPRDATLTAAIIADVSQKLVDEGDDVKAGQLLIQLDPRDVKLVYEQRLAEVHNLQAKIKAELIRHEADKKSLEHEKNLVALKQRAVDRRVKLYDKKLGSEAELDTAREDLAQQKLTLTAREQAIEDHQNRLAQLEAQLKSAESIAQQAKIDVERSQIKAPFDGRIADVHVSVGNRVRPGDALIELFDDQELEVRAQIPASYTAIVREAFSKNIKLKATTVIDQQQFSLTLDRLGAEVGSGRAGVDGLFTVDKENKLLEIGKTITILLQLLPQNNVTAIPSSALYSLDRIYRYNDGRMESATVKLLGSITDSNGNKLLLIHSPELKNGDQVIVTQLPNAMNGLKVNIVSTDEGS